MILHADCTREECCENDAAFGTIARETEKRLRAAGESGRGEAGDEKKRDGKKEGQWTTKGRAWLERRDDGAGKERGKKGRRW